jgi:hypothetical protein
MTAIHSPPNDRDLDEIFVFLSIDEDGKRGIVAGPLPGYGLAPFVTGSPKAAEYMKAVCADLARETGKRIAMVRFTRGEETWST